MPRIPILKWFRRKNTRGKDKGRRIEAITRHTIQTVETWINNYPRKILDFASPKQCFLHELKEAVA